VRCVWSEAKRAKILLS